MLESLHAGFATDLHPKVQDMSGTAPTFRQSDVTRADRRHTSLPYNLPPRGLDRLEAASYVGVGATLFDDMVTGGRMPKPLAVGTRKIWDRLALDKAFDALSAPGAGNPWDQP
jgi:hypothetical protein